MIETILSLCRSYVDHTDAKRYSHAHRALTLLADAVRACPAWLLPAPAEPAAEVERIIADTRYRVGNEDGHLVLSISDGDDAAVLVLTDDEAGQLRADLQRVLAAMAAGKEAA